MVRYHYPTGASDFGSIETEREDIGNTHTLGPNETLSTAFSDHGGEIIDLAGRIYETGFLDDAIPSDTTIRNGTIKLADGSDSDFIYIAPSSSRVTFENVTFDFNGANNTGTATNNGWMDLQGTLLKLHGCRFENANGRSSGEMALYVDANEHLITDCFVALGANENDSHIEGSQGRRVANTFTNCRNVNFDGPDTVSVGLQSYSNDTGLRLAPPGTLTDMQFIGVTVEDNTAYGLRVTAGIDDYENVIVRGKFQGNQGPGAELDISKSSGDGNIVVGGTFKRNQFQQAGGAQVRIREADGAKVEIDQMTNINGTDANWAVYEDSAAEDTRIDHHHVDATDFATAILGGSGVRTIINGQAQESANAEQPQVTGYDDLPVWVDFTDSGDGSGDGIYYIDRGETVHGPI